MAYIGVSPSNGVRRVHTYTATASQTTFSGAGAEGTSLSYKDSNFVDVYQNGIKLGDADYTSTSGTSIVLAQGASVDDLVVVVVFDVFSVADTVSKADGGTFDGNVTMGGSLSAKGGAVFNEDSADVDFRIESNSNANMFFVDASNDKIGINNNAPNRMLGIENGDVQIHETGSSDPLLQFSVGNTQASPTQSYSLRIDNSDSDKFQLINGTSGEIALSVDTTGAITKPKQPAFSAHLSSTSSAFATDGSAVTVAFASERFDTNSDFASNTFTAPVTGKYLLGFHLRINNADSAATYYIPTLVTSNHSYRDIINPKFSSDPAYISMQLTVVADMDANDTAYVTIQQYGGSSQSQIDGGNDYTFFSGHLVG